jgi:hypothetical protein
MHRFSLKTGLKATAIALIALPEPFTTALGIIILCSTLAAYRKKSLYKFGDPEVLVKRSLQNTETVGFRRYFGGKQAIVNHVIKLDMSSQPNIPPQYHAWFDNHKMSESVLHHTLKTSFPQYEAAPAKAASLKKAELAVEYHKLKLYATN